MSASQALIAECLPLRLSAHQLLHFALLRSACVLAGLQWILRFALLARRAFEFFAFVFAEGCCICHEFLFFNLVNCVIWKFRTGIEARCKLPNYPITSYQMASVPSLRDCVNIPSLPRADALGYQYTAPSGLGLWNCSSPCSPHEFCGTVQVWAHSMNSA